MLKYGIIEWDYSSDIDYHDNSAIIHRHSIVERGHGLIGDKYRAPSRIDKDSMHLGRAKSLPRAW